MFDSYLDVTDNQTNVTKRIDKSVMKTFDEGRKITKTRSSTSWAFDILRVFERDGDIYFLSYYEVGFLGDPCYYFVTKWNFETEKCQFHTAVYFENYPNSIGDMYIISSK